MDIQRGFRIGPWTVSPLTGEIESSGQAVHLEPKVMEVLVVLAEQAESVVLRDELLEKVWGARAAISDEPLTRCIAQLRQSFGDSSRDPKYIQTLPKRGYRLMLPVEPIDSTLGEQPPAASPQQPGSGSRRAEALHTWQSFALIGALALLGFIAYQALPLIVNSDDSRLVDRCRIESIEDPFRTIDDRAYELCTEGVQQLDERTAASFGFAMDSFRRAMEVEPNYGSAIVNLARSMVLLQSYQEIPDPRDCTIGTSDAGEADCYDAALKLLDLYIADVPYIEDYVYGIKGYVYTKQRQWRLAAVQFDRARMETPTDADMWQWYSQFHASVGDLDSALAAIEEAHSLNDQSGVILDRYGVLLMWHERYDEAALRFNEAAAFPHVPYQASHLVWSIIDGQQGEVRRLLAQHAGSGRTDAAWIDDFLAGLVEGGDRQAAIRAVEAAIRANDLTGQYVYGAWVLLDEPERAVRAALMLLDDQNAAISVEFLFVPQTQAMRQLDEFEGIVDRLNLNDYWSADPANCPALFARPDEKPWCR